MAFNEVYQVKMKQTYFTQDLLNVFYYRQNAAGPAVPSYAEQLFDAFDANVLSVWTTAINTSLSVTTVEVINLPSPSDTYEGTPTNNQGARAIADNLRAPSFICASFKSARAGAGSRASFKRFAGLAEVDIDDNSISPAFVTLAAGLRSAMGQILTSAQGSSFTPVQVTSATVKVGFSPVVNYTIQNWFDPTLSTQVSRKP